MNAEQFIEKNYFGLKIDCQRDIQTIYQALEDYARALQLMQTDVVGQSEELCDCEIPKPIDPYDSIDKNICRDCKCVIV